jgi:hypothetical protein
MIRALLILALAGAAWGQGAPIVYPIDPDQEGINDPFAGDETDGEAEPRAFTQHRADSILLDSVVRESAPFVQVHLAGSVYDARRDAFIGRVSPSLIGGYRFTFFGFYLITELDQTFDFTLETERLDLMNVGAGFEFLNFLGHVRTSLAVGTSILLSDTSIDEAGEYGWFIDFRPGALRWGIGDSFVAEVTPIALDIVTPVYEGIPLIVWSYTTLVGFEWSAQ